MMDEAVTETLNRVFGEGHKGKIRWELVWNDPNHQPTWNELIIILVMLRVNQIIKTDPDKAKKILGGDINLIFKKDEQ